MIATSQLSGQFSPGVYDNSDLPLTDLERQILELRSRDRHEEIVGETGTLIKSPEVGAFARVTSPFVVLQWEVDGAMWSWFTRSEYHQPQVPAGHRRGLCSRTYERS